MRPSPGIVEMRRLVDNAESRVLLAGRGGRDKKYRERSDEEEAQDGRTTHPAEQSGGHRSTGFSQRMMSTQPRDGAVTVCGESVMCAFHETRRMGWLLIIDRPSL